MLGIPPHPLTAIPSMLIVIKSSPHVKGCFVYSLCLPLNRDTQKKVVTISGYNLTIDDKLFFAYNMQKGRYREVAFH